MFETDVVLKWGSVGMLDGGFEAIRSSFSRDGRPDVSPEETGKSITCSDDSLMDGAVLESTWKMCVGCATISKLTIHS
jgi:hypothetical protein